MSCPELSVIIVNFNACETLLKGLTSLCKASSEISTEIILVDNASTDDSVKSVKEVFPQIKVIANKRNLGFAKGVNIGVRHSQTPFVLLFNPDALVSAKTLQQSLQTLKQSPTAGILGVLNLDAENRPRISCHKQSTFFKRVVDIFSLDQRLPKLFKGKGTHYELTNEELQTVGWVPGSFFLTRRELWLDIGELDESFFLYEEDADFCRRAAEKGWQVVFNPKISIVHLGGVSSKACGDEMTGTGRQLINFRYESRYLFYKKYFGKFKAMVLMVLEMINQLLILGKSSLIPNKKNNTKCQESKATFKALGTSVLGFKYESPFALSKQKTLENFPKISIVVIGLNVEKHLRETLLSLRSLKYPQKNLEIIYVDSGSEDKSIAIAQSFPKVQIISLTDPYPNAAKGRNAGWQKASFPFVQFLDGDSQLDSQWFQKAVPWFNDNIAAVCGVNNEKYPKRNFYHKLSHIEWQYKTGLCSYFGGNVLVRRETLKEVGGFDVKLVAGEEPDLSVRMRRVGWKLLRLNENMTTHDINMSTFRQYFNRSARSGYAYAQVGLRYARSSTKLWLRELLRPLIRFSGVCVFLSLGYVADQFVLGFVISLCLLLKPFTRFNEIKKRHSLSNKDTFAYISHLCFVAFPQCIGILSYLKTRFLR